MRQVKGADTMRELQEEIRRKMFVGTNEEDALARLSEQQTLKAITLSITTRGIGLGICHLTFISISYHENIRIPSAYAMYRVFLGLMEAKLEDGLKKDLPVVPRLNDYIKYPGVSSDMLRVAQSVSIVPEPIRRIINAVGYVKHSCLISSDKMYVPAVADDPVNQQGVPIPRPENILLSTLRRTVEYLANDQTSQRIRRRFHDNCPIPGAIWVNDVLQNPDEIMPRNYDMYEDFRRVVTDSAVPCLSTEAYPHTGDPLKYRTQPTRTELSGVNVRERTMSRDGKNPTADVPTEPGSAHMSPDVFRVGVKLPPFWPDEPAVWFAQVEGHFMLSRISDDKTKFYYIVSQLEHRYAAEVKDIIIAPPAGCSYETLKAELIKRLSQSREKEVKQLLTHEELGDRRPSQFLRHLRHLAGSEVPEEFLKTIWTSRLPPHVQTAIASQPRSDLNSLDDLADAVMYIVHTTPIVASTAAAHNTSLEIMSRQITQLTRKVEALTTGNRRSRTQNREQRNRSRSRSQTNYKKFPKCWYHYKFGPKSTKCQKPCDFSENSQGGR